LVDEVQALVQLRLLYLCIKFIVIHIINGHVYILTLIIHKLLLNVSLVRLVLVAIFESLPVLCLIDTLGNQESQLIEDFVILHIEEPCRSVLILELVPNP
jgi:hypothetical protein